MANHDGMRQEQIMKVQYLFLVHAIAHLTMFGDRVTLMSLCGAGVASKAGCARRVITWVQRGLQWTSVYSSLPAFIPAFLHSFQHR